jgi:hypothetical protein
MTRDAITMPAVILSAASATIGESWIAAHAAHAAATGWRACCWTDCGCSRSRFAPSPAVKETFVRLLPTFLLLSCVGLPRRILIAIHIGAIAPMNATHIKYARTAVVCGSTEHTIKRRMAVRRARLPRKTLLRRTSLSKTRCIILATMPSAAVAKTKLFSVMKVARAGANLG